MLGQTGNYVEGWSVVHRGKYGGFILLLFLWIAGVHKTQIQSGQNPKIINTKIIGALAGCSLSFGNLSSCQDRESGRSKSHFLLH